MNTTLLTVLIAGASSILSAGAALFGIYLGRRMDVRSEWGRADRDRMLASYQKLITEFFSLREALRRVALSEPDPNNLDRNTEEARIAGVEWNRAVFGVWLNGSNEVAVHVKELDEYMNALFKAGREEQYTLDEWQEVRSPAQQSMDGYLDLVRRELNLAPHKIVSDYKP